MHMYRARNQWPCITIIDEELWHETIYHNYRWRKCMPLYAYTAFVWITKICACQWIGTTFRRDEAKCLFVFEKRFVWFLLIWGPFFHTDWESGYQYQSVGWVQIRFDTLLFSPKVTIVITITIKTILSPLNRDSAASLYLSCCTAFQQANQLFFRHLYEWFVSPNIVGRCLSINYLLF